MINTLNRNNIQFSVPYNGSVPSLFLNEVLKRIEYIDHIYCELPFNKAISHFKPHINDLQNYDSQKIYMNRCKEFLKISCGKVKRICTVNATFYSFISEQDLLNFCNNIIKIVDEYKIDGLILTNYSVGRIIHQLRPELELHTSCNCHIWNIKQMQMWQDNVGIKVFNPPREILRIPNKLKEMAEAGFKLKCLINAACLFDCPNSIDHGICIAQETYFCGKCYQNGIGDIFRTNFIVPRWIDYFKDYVTIFKINGRNSTKKAKDSIDMRPFLALDAFISKDNKSSIFKFFQGGPLMHFKYKVPKEIRDRITLDKVPDKLLTCECKDCKNCGLCDKIVKDLIPEEYHHIFDVKQNTLDNIKAVSE